MKCNANLESPRTACQSVLSIGDSHHTNLTHPLMLLRSQRVVIQCSTDTYLKLLTGRHVSSVLSDTAEVFGICVPECLDLSVCVLLMCALSFHLCTILNGWNSNPQCKEVGKYSKLQQKLKSVVEFV